MFRKLLDQGQAGDNVGILLRGTKREDVERGQVLCQARVRSSPHHFTGEVYVLKDEVAVHAVLQQLPPAVLLPHDGRDRRHQLPGQEMVMPGDNVSITVKLINPIAMEEGLRFAIREGGKTVGAGVVAEDHRVTA